VALLNLRPVVWVGASLRKLRAFPDAVQDKLGYALYVAQAGAKHPSAKPLKGFGGAGVLEIVEDHDGSSYRAVYTVRFAEAIYALHAFQKKSTQGIATPKRILDLVRARLKQAEEIHTTYASGKERRES
jgi:phage-related protein